MLLCTCILPCPSWVGLVGLGLEEACIVVRDFTGGVTGDIAEGRDGLFALSPDHGIQVVLQGMERGDHHVDVVDADAHLWVWQRGVVGQGKRKGCGHTAREGNFTHVTCDTGILLIVLLGTWHSIGMQSYTTR